MRWTNCGELREELRVRARTVGLGRHDLEGAAAELEALERAERGARVVVDAPLVRLVRDAVEPLRRQQQHALLLHAPLVHREHRPPGEQRLALADDALGVLDRAPHRLGLLARHRRHHPVLEQHLQVADRAGLLDRLHDRVERRPPRRAGARQRPGGGADVDGLHRSGRRRRRRRGGRRRGRRGRRGSSRRSRLCCRLRRKRIRRRRRRRRRRGLGGGLVVEGDRLRSSSGQVLLVHRRISRGIST